MIQQLVEIPLPDGKVSYSLLNRADSDDFVIFLHSLASHTARTLPYLFAYHLQAHGFNVLRLGQYDHRDHGRKLVDCTMAIHAQDLNTAISYVHTTYNPKRIHVVGHSFGGPTILLAKPKAISAILLDPSHPSRNPFRDARYIKELDLYVKSSSGLDYHIGPAMVKEAESWNHTDLTAGYSLPTLIISAGASPLMEVAPAYLAGLQADVKQTIIEGADHTFSAPVFINPLLHECVAWLKDHRL